MRDVLGHIRDAVGEREGWTRAYQAGSNGKYSGSNREVMEGEAEE